jgi:hypothetical protein
MNWLYTGDVGTETKNVDDVETETGQSKSAK